MEAKHDKIKEEIKISGDWNKKAAALKEKFSHLTEPDLKLEKDKEDEWNKRKDLFVPKKQQ